MKKKKGKSALILVIVVIICITWIISSKRVVYQEKIIYKETQQKTTEDIKKYENIVFLGDSIMNFYPTDSIYDINIINSGVPGYKTENVLSQLDTMVYQYNPTSVFILIGTNDLAFNSAANKDQTISNMKEIISNIKKNRKKTKIYLESIYPVNENINYGMVSRRDNQVIREINEEMKKYCEKNDVTFINMYKELVNENGNFAEKYTNDGLHPNSLGYAKISQILIKYIYNISEK